MIQKYCVQLILYTKTKQLFGPQSDPYWSHWPSAPTVVRAPLSCLSESLRYTVHHFIELC